MHFRDHVIATEAFTEKLLPALDESLYRRSVGLDVRIPRQTER
ncbi:hypothetical protein HDG35_006959 [Paraburkholderia sp. JPY681]|nr:hypothetical protein [Paraburkholderia atlantica]MBB5510662.1 hypothetical protein [Paraburkholderia atlantica]